MTKDGLGAATRKGKQHDLAMPELRRLWLARLTDDDRRALAASAAKCGPHGPGNPAQIPDLAIARAIRQSFATGHALVPEKRLVALALSEAVGSITAREIRRRLPGFNIVFRDYDGKRFCAQRDPETIDAEHHAFLDQAVYHPWPDEDQCVAAADHRGR